MNIYALVRHTCEESGFSVATGAVQRLVGTLRSAGFSDSLSSSEVVQVKRILAKRFKELSSPQLRTAEVESPITSTAKFEEIETLRSRNLCPRCKSEMEEVKLANYEKARFCAKCKVALWID